MNDALELAILCRKYEEMCRSAKESHLMWYLGEYSLTVLLVFNEDKTEIRVRGEDLAAVVEEAYTRYRRLVSRLPEFDANRALAAPSSQEPPDEDLTVENSEEIPF